MPVRIFYAHRKATSDADIDAQVPRLTAKLRELNPSVDLVVIPGRDDFKARGRMGWDSWACLLGAGTRSDGEPEYHAFVVPDREIGRVTAQLLEHALQAGKQVVYWDPQQPATVAAVRRVWRNNGSWQTGWSLVF